MNIERIVLNEERNVTLTAYIQDVGGEFQHVTKRPAILILPGGGYQMCSDREADPVAMPYLKAGYQAFILRYSVKKDSLWPNPLDDYEMAMELIRSKGDEWNLYEDKVAVIGFSAGGHLAASAATMSRNRPNAAILGYAVINDDVKMCSQTAPSAVDAVDDNTCPCFIFSSRTDNVVPIESSIEFMSALTKHNISFESHIYAFGPHGFSTCDNSIQLKNPYICERIPNWVDDSIGWLKDVMGDFGKEGMTEPICKGHTNGDRLPFLSIDCTLTHLMKNEKAREIIEPMMANMHNNNSGEHELGEDNDIMKAIFSRMQLKDLLAFGEVTEDFIKQLDEQLSKIPNS